jgi:hypothetical protein
MAPQFGQVAIHLSPSNQSWSNNALRAFRGGGRMVPEKPIDSKRSLSFTKDFPGANSNTATSSSRSTVEN